MKVSLKMKILVFVSAAVWGLCWGSLYSSEAAVANVSVVNYAFVPPTSTINTGDMVVWTWNSGSIPHNVTSSSMPSAWPASPSTASPEVFSNTFASSGTFPYLCTIHGFTGSIVVNGVVVPPTVNVTSPTNGTVYATPASVTIKATASETGGTIASVEFRVDSNVLADQTTGPYSVTTNNLAAGSHSLTAIAIDGHGAKATNTVNVSVVAPSPLMLSAAARGGTSFHFTYTANAGLSYIVQRSTNLISASWQTLVTNTASGSSINFTDINTTAGPGFYRIGRMPNP